MRKEIVNMNKKFGWIIGALVIALLAVGVFGITSAFADDGGPPGKRDGKRNLDDAALETVADVLNMSTDEVTAALKDGKTLPELADEAGVDMQEIKDALIAVREEAIREHIAQALEDGKISQEKADWLLEGLDKGFLGGKGFDFGDRGGGRFQKPDSSATPDVSF
jgi:hypothetical protein